MINYRQLEQQFASDLGLVRRPIAMAMSATPPAGVAKFEGTYRRVAPSGAWHQRDARSSRCRATTTTARLAAYTHSIPLPPDRAQELDETLAFMTGIGYLRMEEVPDIPVLPTTPGAVVYAPLGDTPVDPDVVLFWGPASRVMLLQEAAIRAGVSGLNTFGRPTCMAVPAALALGMVASTGCVGNRVYTGAEEGEMYAAVPGKDLVRLAETTSTIKSANAQLMDYHKARRTQLTA